MDQSPKHIEHCNGVNKPMNTVFCPVMEKEIDGTNCLIICDVADKFIKPTVLPEGIKWSEEQRAKCKGGIYHSDIS